MIRYRPHRRTLEESMAEEQIFETKEQMFEYVANCWDGILTKEDLSISDNLGRDNRIDWRETRYVCTRRFGNVEYDVPQCVGMCSIE